MEREGDTEANLSVFLEPRCCEIHAWDNLMIHFFWRVFSEPSRMAILEGDFVLCPNLLSSSKCKSEDPE